jgi:hypothetical protein
MPASSLSCLLRAAPSSCLIWLLLRETLWFNHKDYSSTKSPFHYKQHSTTVLASSRLPPRPSKGPNSILSHSHTIPLALFYYGPPTHLSLAHFLTYRHPFTNGQPVPLDSSMPITRYLFALGSLIALMMEAARTSETSVDIDLTIRQYISEDSELPN